MRYSLNAHSQYRDIVRLLESNVGSRRMSSVFEDFVELVALAVRNSVDRCGREERESRYLKLADSYTREQMNRFAEAFALVTMRMQEKPEDVLGRLYMELDLGNERLGQFYTPYDVATLIAGMTIGEIVDQVEQRGMATLYEPACGAGAFIVAVTQEMHRAELSYQRQLLVTAEDLASQAVHMCYLQLTLLHVPAVVHHRNTLSDQTFDSWPTPAYILNGWGLA